MNDTSEINGRLYLETLQKTHGPNRAERAAAEVRKIQEEGRVTVTLRKYGIAGPGTAHD